MAITYILFSSSCGKFYVGSSRNDNIRVRLSAHNAGRVKSTKSYRPWTIVTTEKLQSYSDARKRELFLKSGVGRKLIAEKFGFLKS
ncbi:MAG: GIY-YIG nuclease family protein [Candidatus Sungiibacteriota bacterium]|uniref:GIY-YIG nuclease family protein n=1 Tax=Candidatus Sungiibacteriota bacterium TaxID=2750080 RepID=A0A7T5RK49_9BACT|nr:MAG: GIY-YIG nuclease family protein [Candidatus Sungbacteria bacterium]